MPQQTIKYTISQDGTVAEEVIGVKGTQCLDLTEKIEDRLGVVQWRKETEEYWQQLDEEMIEEFTHDSEGC